METTEADLGMAPPVDGNLDLAANSARVCKQMKPLNLHNQQPSFLTSYAISVSNEKRHFPSNQEAVVALSYIYDTFLLPLVTMERRLCELKTDYVHKAVQNHHQDGRKMCPSCTRTAQEIENDLQLILQDLKLKVVHLYEHFNFVGKEINDYHVSKCLQLVMNTYLQCFLRGLKNNRAPAGTFCKETHISAEIVK